MPQTSDSTQNLHLEQNAGDQRHASDRALAKAPPKNWFRGFIQGKTRAVLHWIFAASLIFSARELPHWTGISLCLAGAILRVWASGYLRKDSRLAVGGPYQRMRNPLYLGTYLMAIGSALAVKNLWLFGGASVLFAVLYHYIILDEEVKLQAHFGRPFELWCKHVPRFFPRFLPVGLAAGRTQLLADLREINPDPSHRAYSWRLAWQNKAYEALASFLGLIGGIALIAWIRSSFL